MYIGNAYISQLFELSMINKVIISILIWSFAMLMIFKYAPADTEDVPIISKRERKKRKNISYLIASLMIIIACLINNSIISNILLLGVLIQTITITRFAYRLTKNRYGHEEYYKNKNIAVN